MLISHTITFVKNILSHVIPVGGVAIDATVGNGMDTEFLARTVGVTGKVHGFDVQQMALDATFVRLEKLSLNTQVALHLVGHENMASMISEDEKGQVDAIMFNLGYLPQSDESIVTKPDTTCAAIDAGLSIMHPGAVMSLVLYTGHQGGAEELSSVEAHCRSLNMNHVRVLEAEMINHPSAQTRLMLLEKR